MQYTQNYLEPSTKAVKVLIVDDNLWMREGLKTLLKSSPEVCIVGEASSGAEALRLVTEVRPDVALMDIAMPDTNGLETTRQLKRIFPECAVIMLTFMQEQEYMREALECGASGYLTKEVGRDELLYAIQEVVRGDVQIQPGMLRTFIEETIIGPLKNEVVKPTEVIKVRAQNTVRKPLKNFDSALPHFSRREFQILKLLSKGLSNGDIADKLDISASTVKTHVDAIFRKLGVHDRTTAALTAARLGLLDDDKAS